MVLSRDENTYSAIEVEFNDATKHRTMRLTDHYGFSMAALDDAAGGNGEAQADANVIDIGVEDDASKASAVAPRSAALPSAAASTTAVTWTRPGLGGPGWAS